MRTRALGAALTILLTAAAGNAARADGPPTLAVGVRADAESLDPARGDGPLAREVRRLVLPSLTDQAPDTLAVIPGLAVAWHPSGNGLEYTYELRHLLTWSDGQPVTAGDVVYSITRAREENWPVVGAAVSELDAEVIDERHVLVRSTRFDPRLPLLDVPILPEHVFAAVRPDAPETELLGVGAGPFVLAERAPGFVRLVANDRYFGGRPMLDEVTFRVFDSGPALVEALERREIDVATDLDPGLFDRINGNERISPLTVNEGAYWALAVNLRDGHPSLRDARVRRALNLAVDRSVIVNQALGGVGHPATLPVVSRSPLWQLDPDRYEGFGYDPVGARDLLDETGLADDDGDGRREDAAGDEVVLTLVVPAEPQEAQPVAELVAGWLADVGLGADIAVADGPRDGEPADLAFVARTPAYDPTPLTSELSCGGPGATGTARWWCDAEFDRLFAAQAAERDPVAREDMVEQMLLLLQEQAPEVLLVHPDILQAYRTDRFRKWTPQPFPDGPVVFSATSPSYLLIESAPEVGHDEASDALMVVGAAGVAGLLAMATLALVVVRHRRATRPAGP